MISWKKRLCGGVGQSETVSPTSADLIPNSESAQIRPLPFAFGKEHAEGRCVSSADDQYFPDGVLPRRVIA